LFQIFFSVFKFLALINWISNSFRSKLTEERLKFCELKEILN
jgi:hypothetical protein